MTPEDLRIVAATLKRAKPWPIDGRIRHAKVRTEMALEMWTKAVSEIAGACREQNETFDPSLFWAACGYNADE
jgi:hypothetical protein